MNVSTLNWVTFIHSYYTSQHSESKSNKKLDLGPLQGDRALLGGSEYALVEILQNGACQKNIKNLF